MARTRKPSWEVLERWEDVDKVGAWLCGADERIRCSVADGDVWIICRLGYDTVRGLEDDHSNHAIDKWISRSVFHTPITYW